MRAYQLTCLTVDLAGCDHPLCHHALLFSAVYAAVYKLLRLCLGIFKGAAASSKGFIGEGECQPHVIGLHVAVEGAGQLQHGILAVALDLSLRAVAADPSAPLAWSAHNAALSPFLHLAGDNGRDHVQSLLLLHDAVLPVLILQSKTRTRLRASSLNIPSHLIHQSQEILFGIDGAASSPPHIEPLLSLPSKLRRLRTPQIRACARIKYKSHYFVPPAASSYIE